ncbi:uncharacterized protein PODANS_4_6300 [Podospora anserina S mat+]|uniref:Podospora anserina S mat+ genomic DNA chromosome 4, supercontig 4 n=1 Tax=Podospora anserina (strain S / ATCC MYA-4624 / DSM 980 / FGSC 10383) TaxID=515849 RepID=B2APU0_PODAN|nr:uncharacterized protein PODANS_4_6300 [Podospora anserina S mat+]CAP66879.1 unnamed protein product [Podospora anserina S mat+]CDP28621.1 Putative protein of unknown function [Podospora anserina S mat+]
MGGNGPLDAGTQTCAERNRKQLIDDFGSVLEESLIILLTQDYDIEKDYDEITRVLRGLAESATAEAATGFDPSGLGFSVPDLDEPRLDDATTTSDNRISDGSGGDYTGTSPSDFSSDSLENQILVDPATFTEDHKIAELRGIFIDRFTEHTLRRILGENGGDLNRTFDDLLNRQFLEDSGDITKGIDAFFVGDNVQYPPKGKGKRRKGLPKKNVLAVNYKATSVATDGEELHGARDFIQPSSGRATPKRIQPYSLPAINTSSSPASKKTAAILSPTPQLDFGTSHLHSAASLRRQGPLARQGAVVYVERAREQASVAFRQASEYADERARQQSTAIMVDLHGVHVLDGVRIAREHVWRWWNNLGENRAAEARDPGFTVVTGLGRHSAGGVSRLRQAVGAMLKNDGWRVETLTGSFHIRGRV